MYLMQQCATPQLPSSTGVQQDGRLIATILLPVFNSKESGFRL